MWIATSLDNVKVEIENSLPVRVSLVDDEDDPTALEDVVAAVAAATGMPVESVYLDPHGWSTAAGEPDITCPIKVR